MQAVILINAATEREMSSVDNLPGYGLNSGEGGCRIDKLVSGVGPVATIFALMDYISKNKIPDKIVNIGIAGSFKRDISPGTVTVVAEDRFGDLGVDDNGRFIPADRTGFHTDDEYTPLDRYNADMSTLTRLSHIFPVVKGLTVTSATGSETKMLALVSEYDPDIETMEGASVYYVCNKLGIPCIGIRAISNMVGPRNKSEWVADMALDKLSAAVTGHINDILL